MKLTSVKTEVTSDYEVKRRIKNIKNLKKVGEILRLLLRDPSEFETAGDFRKRVFSILPEDELKEMIIFLKSGYLD